MGNNLALVTYVCVAEIDPRLEFAPFARLLDKNVSVGLLSYIDGPDTCFSTTIEFDYDEINVFPYTFGDYIANKMQKASDELVEKIEEVVIDHAKKLYPKKTIRVVLAFQI